MQTLARWLMQHRRLVVIAWIAAVVGVSAVASSVGDRAANNLTLPGTGTQQAVDLLRSHFPAQAGDADQIVFHARQWDAREHRRPGRDRHDAGSCRTDATRGRGGQPVRRRPTGDLPGRHDRLRDGPIRQVR